MNDQFLQPAMFGHLLNLNRFNNQLFFMRGFGHTFNNSINSIQLGSTLLGHYLQDFQTLIGELQNETGSPSGTFQNECSGILTTMTQVVQGISDSTLNLDQFVSHLAELTGQHSRVRSGCSRVDLNQLVTLCSTMIRHQTVQYTHNFRLDLNDAPAIWPDCAVQITQVMLNLMMNALLSLPDKSREIVVSTSCDHDVDRAIFLIRDEGIGISESVLPRIIEPFFTTWHEQGCAGLGLTVADRIIRNHGGELSIISEQDQGTTVRVSIPLCEHANQESPYVC